jgi:hypothetical protein
VEYLGHIMGKDDVRMDPTKIEAMQDLNHPKTLKSLCGFLGLTGYYHKLIKNYGKIVAPLTTLLKNNAFIWTPTTDQTFQALKDTMCMTLVLTLPKTFVLEYDASRKGIGPVLMQDDRPLAFIEKQILDIHLGQSIYEKEMLFILESLSIGETLPY